MALINDPIVSICVPAYKYPDLLRRSLISIINQSYPFFEVIVTDDSGHDELQQVVFEIGDERIRYYKNPIPLGSPANWNEGIKHALGAWVKIMHHDDWFSTNDALKEFMDATNNNPKADFIFSNFFNSKPTGISLNKPLGKIYLKKIAAEPATLIYLNGIGAPSTIMYKRSINIRFDDASKWCVDVIFYTQILKQNSCFHYIQSPLLNVTANAATQITNNTDGSIKVNEVIYSFDKFGYFSTKKTSMMFVIYFIELFKRYNIHHEKQIVNFGYNANIINKLKLALRLSKFPLHYKFFSLLRVLYYKYCPF